MASTAKNRKGLVYRGNLRKSMKQFVSSATALLAFNGNQPLFPLFVFPPQQRSNIQSAIIQTEKNLTLVWPGT